MYMAAQSSASSHGAPIRSSSIEDLRLQAAPHLEVGPLFGRVLPLHLRILHLRTNGSRFDRFDETLELRPFPLPDGFHRVVSHVAHPACHADLACAVLHMGAEAHALHASLDHYVHPLYSVVVCH